MIDIQKIKRSCEMDPYWHLKPLGKGKMDDVTRSWILQVFKDKELVGKVVADIKFYKPVEPYKQKGITSEGQFILKKEGKKK